MSIFNPFANSLNPNLQSAVNALIDLHDADFFLYNGPINTEGCDGLMGLIRNASQTQKRSNAILVLTTGGGDPDDGFRAMQLLKRAYQRVRLYVFGICKSAGTMMAWGASEIIMGDFGEFGPLDVQISMESESGRSFVSGLTYNQAIGFLTSQSVAIFNQLQNQLKSAGHSPKQAYELAAKLSVDIISPISSQIEPQRLGEFNRAMQIASMYCQRLNPSKGANANALAAQYPSHSFVITMEEASGIFGNVSAPDGVEIVLEKELLHFMRRPVKQPPAFAHLPIHELVMLSKMEHTHIMERDDVSH